MYYYYYVGQNDSSVTWYECESISDDTTQLPMANAGMLNYYKCAGDAKTTKMFESVYANNQLYIEMTANSSQLLIDGTNKKANIPGKIDICGVPKLRGANKIQKWDGQKDRKKKQKKITVIKEGQTLEGS